MSEHELRRDLNMAHDEMARQRETIARMEAQLAEVTRVGLQDCRDDMEQGLDAVPWKERAMIAAYPTSSAVWSFLGLTEALRAYTADEQGEVRNCPCCNRDYAYTADEGEL